ncbi:hypothetical protein L1987_79901 [Smallanthus sonchifolius]|uniref:Uncharacterized protein n=1 Tax=Smallanthus sonchifolius TaxID=185202 RepID=A0ACB8YKH4_9ASTR|nr:hypothetical protein L1987_79901 [Smallanthus sonchifolius]
MGNCVRKDSGKQRAGDYWDSPAEKSLLSGEPHREIGKRGVARDEDSGKRPTKEVKIKITKKQLEELLGMKEMQGLTLEQVLTRLINGGDGVFQSSQRSWRPALQSIPE